MERCQLAEEQVSGRARTDPSVPGQLPWRMALRFSATSVPLVFDILSERAEGKINSNPEEKRT